MQQWLRNLPVSRKLTSAFGIVCTLCIVLGVYTTLTFHDIAQRSTEVSEQHIPSLIYIGDIRDGVNSERREDLELLLCQTPACTADHSAKRQAAIASYQNSLRLIDPLIVANERDLYTKFVASIEAYQAIERGIGLLAAGKTGDALDLLSSDATMTSLAGALAAADGGFQLHAKTGSEESSAATSASNHATWINSGMTLLIALLCAITGIITLSSSCPA